MIPCSFKLGTMIINPKRTGLRQPDMPAFLSKGSSLTDTQPLAPLPGMDQSPRLIAAGVTPATASPPARPKAEERSVPSMVSGTYSSFLQQVST